MIYAACVFGGFWVGFLVSSLMVVARELKPPDYDDRPWHDM